MWFSLGLFLLAGFLIVCLVIPGFSLAPWVPTARTDLVRVARLAALQPGEVLYELGCGDGRVVTYLASQHPQATIIGVELSPVLYLWARVRVWYSGLPNARVYFGDALRCDLATAHVVYAFALTETVAHKLKPEIDAELASGSRFLSYAFLINDPAHTQVDRRPGTSTIYCYTKP